MDWNKAFGILSLALAMLCACTKNELPCNPDEGMKRIRVSLNLPKTTLTEDRDRLQWTPGDRIAILNDATPAITELTYENGDRRFEMDVPAGAKKITAIYPSSMSSGISIPESQVQSKAGVLDPDRYPMTAESAIEGNSVNLLFSPSCSALALNIYKSSGLVSGETLKSVTVASCTVTLESAYALGAAAPADKKMFAGQIYLIFPREKVTDLTFTITTSAGAKKLIAKAGSIIDLSESDFFTLNIDLSKAVVEIEDATSEGFTEDEEIMAPEYPEPQDVNIIPDFSSVGYHYGEKEIPTLPAGVSLSAPADGSDATKMIQNAIDACPKGKAVVLGEGTFNVAGTIYIDRSDVALRGAGIGKTVINGTGTVIRDLVVVGKCNRTSTESWNDGGSDQVRHPFVKYSYPASAEALVTDALVPCGRWHVTVDNIGRFAVGDRILIERTATRDWIDHVGPNPGDNNNWSVGTLSYKSRRRVVKISGNKIYLDAPVVFQIESGLGKVYHYTMDSVSEVGIENLSFSTEFDHTVTDNKRGSHTIDPYYADEQKAFTAINIGSAENCWVRDCDACHFTQSFVHLDTYALKTTVLNCRSFDPVSKITGSRRYAFHVAGELCLVKDCVCEKDRHAYVVYAWAKGPNAFVNCLAKNNFDEIGPHQKLSTGGLYDNVSIDNSEIFKYQFNFTMAVFYASNSSGRVHHGWTGANYVFWNCKSSTQLRFFNQAADGIYNYCIGCTGYKQKYLTQYSRYNDDNFEEGCWWPEVEQGGYSSTKINLNSVPAEAAARPWWPQMCGNTYTKPLSLYECQLYDRLATRGIRSDM